MNLLHFGLILDKGIHFGELWKMHIVCWVNQGSVAPDFILLRYYSSTVNPFLSVKVLSDILEPNLLLRGLKLRNSAKLKGVFFWCTQGVWVSKQGNQLSVVLEFRLNSLITLRRCYKEYKNNLECTASIALLESMKIKLTKGCHEMTE